MTRHRSRSTACRSSSRSAARKLTRLYKELVKRGEKLEKDAKSAMHEIELPKLELDNLTDRKKLEQQLKKAKARFNELKQSVGFKAAA